MNKALREARERRGITQQALAERVYISRQTYFRMEREGQLPRLDTAILIAGELGSSVEDLFKAVI